MSIVSRGMGERVDAEEGMYRCRYIKHSLYQERERVHLDDGDDDEAIKLLESVIESI